MPCANRPTRSSSIIQRTRATGSSGAPVAGTWARNCSYSAATAGHAWRREQALALQGEQVSINRIAALFGVTRQRISALLREREREDDDGGDAVPSG